MAKSDKNTLTHLDENGAPRMVDVSEKKVTSRAAVAEGRVVMSAEALDIVRTGGGKKGDALSIAKLAGIMAGKKTSDIIPLCHPLAINSIDVQSEIVPELSAVRFTAHVKVAGQTGVEMEALTAVSAACLTLYDMLKAVDKSMSIENIHLVKKTGGKSGDYHYTEPSRRP